MASHFALLILSSLILTTSFRSAFAGVGMSEDPFICQVVDRSGDDNENSLNADRHFTIFKRRRHQKLDPSAVHGVTQFSDLTPYEFRRQFLGLNRRLRLPIDGNKAPILPTNDTPSDFDWRDHGFMVPSLRTTGALEGANFLATGKLVSLSEQQLVDCDHECDPEEQGSCDSGCNGGLMNSAFEYTIKAGGIMREEDYPYSGSDRGTCKFDNKKVAAKVANFSVVSLDEDQIAANLVKNGPLAVAINVVFMQTYIGSRCLVGWLWFGWLCSNSNGWLWFGWLCSNSNEREALLDHKELVG
ncbi:putative cysteine proteinase [Abeliophyllum distichum]|uniref:Cysteine proteinase n=1 Tax=Abeliophyllum distichum TaxID=126358 RepID=A0ABD1RQH6_9LAMI